MTEQHFDGTRALSIENDSKRTTDLEGLILDIRNRMALETQQPAALISDDPTTYIKQRMHLKRWFLEEFGRSGSIACLDKAMYITHEIAAADLHDRPKWIVHQLDLLEMLAVKHDWLKSSEYLDEAIPIMREMVIAFEEVRVRIVGNTHREICFEHPVIKTIKPIWQLLRDDSHPLSRMRLDEKILVSRVAVIVTPYNDQDRLLTVSGLACYLGKRYIATSSRTDLDESTKLFRSISRRPGGGNWMTSLSTMLYLEYRATGNEEVLNEAIDISWKILSYIPLEHAKRPNSLKQLSGLIMERFSRNGEMADLEQSIKLSKEALQNLPQNSPSRCEFLDTHSLNLTERYGVYGVLQDLDDAIQTAREALELYSKDDPERSGMLSDLGGFLGYRYKRKMAFADIEESIKFSREAVRTTPKGHVERADRLRNLSIRIYDKFKASKQIGDLEESIKTSREAVEESSEDHERRPSHLGFLGQTLTHLYNITKSTKIIDEAIDLLLRAVKITPEEHRLRPEHLNNLGMGFLEKYRQSRDMTDLQETIQYLEEAVKKTAPVDPFHSERSYNLGKALFERYLKTKSRDDVQKAISSYIMALHQLNVSASVRMLAGMNALMLYLEIADWEKAHHTSTVMLELVPELVLRTLPNSDKQRLTKHLNGLACLSAAASLYTEKSPYEILVTLEQGRSVILASVEDMRTDIAELQVKNQALANQFNDLRERIVAVTQWEQPLESKIAHGFGSISDRRHLAGAELDTLIKSIRKQPNFEDFLTCPSQDKIMDAAKNGPVVVVNVCTHRCDALLIDEHGLRVLPLPQLRYQHLELLVRYELLNTAAILSWLWAVVAEPILDALGFTQPPTDENWPHVWWIPTSILSRFPLHAAGYHEEGSFDTVLDRVMSSYSLSVKAIIHGRRRKIRPSTPSNAGQALLVAMENTPSAPRLKYVKQEMDQVQRICKPNFSISFRSDERSHKKDILSELSKCKIFHFAGHGQTNTSDPFKSALLLSEGNSNPMRVSDLLDINLRENAPFVAYLSACGTGQMEDQELFDEVIHLISAYQLAGFRHVIGTLWDVDDKICGEMARITYEQMVHDEMTDESVCLGLHKATRELRDNWLRTSNGARHRIQFSRRAEARPISGESAEIPEVIEQRGSETSRKIVRADSKGLERPKWVPYVHFGV